MPRGISKSKHPEAYSALLYSETAPRAVGTANSPRDLARKRRDLEEWEQSLAKRDELYASATEGADNKLKILDSKIASRAEDLANLDRKLDDKRARMESEIAGLEQRVVDAKARATTATAKANDSRDSVHEIEQLRVASTRRLAELDAEIDGRKQYQKDQEATIDQATQDANAELVRLNREVGQLERDHEDLLARIHGNNLHYADLEAKATAQGDDLVRLQTRYEDAAKGYRADLTEIKLSIAEAEDTRDRVVAEADQVMLELKAERAEIETAREVITRQREEIWAEKRRLESMKAVYGLQ